jgi:hypothetical protein
LATVRTLHIYAALTKAELSSIHFRHGGMYQLINPCTCAVCTIQSVRLRESPSDLALQQSAALGTIWHIATNVRVDEMKWDCSNFCFFFFASSSSSFTGKTENGDMFQTRKRRKEKKPNFNN